MPQDQDNDNGAGVVRQAPTPGPLSGDDVKLLVKGDLLWAAVHGAPVTVIEAVGASVSYRHPEYAPDGCVIVGKGLEWLAFIGRPDADGWMPWSGGENPVPGQNINIRQRGYSFDEAEVWEADYQEWDWKDYDPQPWDIIAFRLTPTAPVEASGSEPSWKTALLELKDKLWIARCDSRDEGFRAAAERAIKMADDADWSPLNLRPQPSGETREAVAREVHIGRFPSDREATLFEHESREAKAYCYRIADRVLSARPLALGGQQGVARWGLKDDNGVIQCLTYDDETSAEVAAKRCSVRLTPFPLYDTTPARAEAQDEGAAGEAYGWIYERLDVGPDWCAGDEWWPAEFTRKAPTPGRSRNIITLYAHPSPTPAADADMVRIAVEALEAEREWHDRIADYAFDEARECAQRHETSDEDEAMKRFNRHTARVSIIDEALAALKSEEK